LKDIAMLGVESGETSQAENSLEDSPQTKGNISLDTQENQSEDDIELNVKDIENIIYNSLFEYWDCPLQICLLATLLDPWLKEMSFANTKTYNNTINKRRLQIHQLMNMQLPTSNNNTSPSPKISPLIICLRNLYLVVLKDWMNL
ncbi:24812_t:CDS:2, partial [Gigaspora margarita]